MLELLNQVHHIVADSVREGRYENEAGFLGSSLKAAQVRLLDECLLGQLLLGEACALSRLAQVRPEPRKSVCRPLDFVPGPVANRPSAEVGIPPQRRRHRLEAVIPCMPITGLWRIDLLGDSNNIARPYLHNRNVPIDAIQEHKQALGSSKQGRSAHDRPWRSSNQSTVRPREDVHAVSML
jgi:hypothetical protein